MFRYDQVKGLTVVTMAEGRKVGKVDELLVDPEAKRISWLRVQSGALFGEQKWVPVEAVHGLGQDAVTIGGEGDIRSSEGAPEAGRLVEARRPVIGNKVVTQDGQFLGKVHDFEFEPGSFLLTNLLLTVQGAEQLQAVPAEQVLTVGQDVIIIAGSRAASSSTAVEPGSPGDHYPE